jgi:hypothetical protein
MIVLWHRGGPQPCNGPALGVKCAPPSRYEIPAEIAVRLDGSAPQRDEPMVCGTCKAPVHPFWLRAE